MREANMEIQEITERIDNIIATANDDSRNKRKDEFADDEYAYSLCDNYKSKKTRNVIIYLLNKDINILYFKDEYKNIILINFLRWCQLNNLNVKKYHDIFLKHEISLLIQNNETYLNFFLKPIINNDRLLWDINTDIFKNFNLQFDIVSQGSNEKNDSISTIYNNTHFVYDQSLKLKLNEFVVNSSDDDSYFSSDDTNSVYAYSDKCESRDSDDMLDDYNKNKNLGLKSISMNNYNNVDTKNEVYITPLSDKLSTVDNGIANNSEEGSKNTSSNFFIDSNNIQNSNFSAMQKNANKIKKGILSSMRNININHLINIIINKDDDEICDNIYNETNDTNELVNKFVSTFENKNEQVKSLYKKINSMEKIIKHLINEIIKRDIIINREQSIETKNVHIEDNRIADKNIVDNKEYYGINKIMENNNTKVEQKNNSSCNYNSSDQGYICSDEDYEMCSNVANNPESTDENNNSKTKSTDDYYFDSYNHMSIHRTMILDKIRTNSYYEFITKNKEIFKNKVVLDIGCGSSIISLFCSDYAKTVVGIDNAEKILNKARKIIKANNAKNIYLFQGKLEDHDIYIDQEEKNIYYINKSENIENYKKTNNITSKLKILKFDIIISEWMGYFLFYECMINTIIYAKHMYLKKDGYIFPNIVHLYLAGYNDSDYINNNFLIWDKPMYNKNFSQLKSNSKQFVQTAKIVNADKNNISTDIVKFATINMYTFNKNDHLYVNSNFKIKINPDKIVTTLCFHFDCEFHLFSYSESMKSSYDTNNINKSYNFVTLSTSILSEKTHWKQTLLHIYFPNYNIANIVANNNNDDNYLSGNIYISQTSKKSRNVSILLDIDKNKNINVNESCNCYYSID
ncbi:histone-arginine methyltransferase CARM1, putative [Plasmodium berghei]|uniref:Histone-arginine methyltransferase CARM1, putative n=2 Tax=Plasmodium berghei TaxID=5821 RepID=A0A509AQE3_PLABA|nr:histone-arginine methyltransferase CARM1, putative [Plasmodium berghei ANKA]CXJ17812.1 histone-arginine methyltransferase CARM1, putative [Plasmodium berghei]SCM26398.1 histone-arginine methyltransferase CARM1, putative [Plasmodium berghei]SCN28435.1 histone-arginine methyltransferase CARM1, putative [Plasmodium berghei]SCO62628.1 histone-arginine methyltransferase CARM1, putative [Plasmodium berghei]SCO64187.1 histone-arginine methyltransferase CARM1, putative [Plasmodium berghei]|eukprot:XP_034424083.1 histone-arginine methyltransferase CARM1, putative [Plasmodium berghei ANKA]